MAALILVFTIVAAMCMGILSGVVVLNLFFQIISRQRQGSAPMAKAVPAL